MAAELESLHKRLRKSERLNEILKNGKLLLQGRDMIFKFIKKSRNLFDISEMCETLEVSTNGFYRWEKAEPRGREVEDESLKKRIPKIHDQAPGDYGHRPIHDDLMEGGYLCVRDRTLRLMNELEISGQ